MKQRFLITAFLVFSLLGAFALKSNAQDRDKCPSMPQVKELIADETTLNETKTGAKIECDNVELANKIMFTFKEDVKRFGWSWRKDRHGAYKHYVIYVDKETGNRIKEWAKTNL